MRRDASLDLIRALAAFLVVSVHFFLNCGFFEAPLVGGRMLAMAMVRMAFMTCVPLFLLLTGYLCHKKALTPRYYLGLWSVLLTYLLCAAVCLALREARGETLRLGQRLKAILDFSAAPYAWYVEMYVGLFLLIPFLNILWKGLETRAKRRALIVTLLTLTTLPALTNFRWALLPDWWSDLYPLTYYFLGAYFAEYHPRPHWGWGVPTLAALAAAGGGVMYALSGGGVAGWNPLLDWPGPTVALSSCLLFLLLLRVPVDRAPGWVKKLLAKLSQLSLAIYLLSWCFDTAFYPILVQKVPVVADRFPWYFVIVPAVYLSSAATAQLVAWARWGITWCINKACPQAKLK